MKRNILLVEPNYKNKFPPVALMKLSTYHKNLGDNVVFYKGNIKDFIVERITDKCIAKLYELDNSIKWESKKDSIFNYIKTRKSVYLEELNLEENNDWIVVENWIRYYKDYYWKKLYLSNPEWDRIFVTTLFTFYFDITVDTINQLKGLVKPGGLFMVGGVLATLQPNELEQATGIKPYRGLLNHPGDLDNGDEQIIDELPLDYTILDEIEYKYSMSNAYYGYLTRGCIRHCTFCAVPTLEPKYEDYIPLKERIAEVDRLCGPQRNLLLMDNNVMASKSFDKIIQEIIDCGFGKGATYLPADLLAISIKNLKEGINDRAYIRKTQALLMDYYRKIEKKPEGEAVFKSLFNHHVFKLITSTKEGLLAAYEEIEPLYRKRRIQNKPKQRVVDFNQGVDARLFTPHMAEQFGRIAISPLRIAFDHIEIKETYINALRMSAENGIKNFSNYLLYNFNDKPIDLYRRMEINVNLCDELDVNIYSFPMKYHPLYGNHSHDRDYIGKHWNVKYIRSIQAILNCTKGMIGRGTHYFYKAFGKNEQEYMTLLEMPDTFIIYRFFFEWLDTKSHPLSMSCWVKAMNSLNEEEKGLLFSITHKEGFSSWNGIETASEKVNAALIFYKNLRDDIAKEKGCLYELKKEFDSLDKATIDYIKESSRIIDL